MNNLKKHFSNIPGWRTPRKIVVIESDDWGSIRMPSLKAAARLEQKGVLLGDLDALRFNQNDTLATADDLISLFDVLQKFRDRKNNPATFTAVSIVANPDFEKIRKHNFECYFFEPFTDTLSRYYSHNQIFSLWMQGLQKGLFVPQFHGREHLNVSAWMYALQQKDKHTIAAFNEGCWGFKNSPPGIVNYQAAFDLTKTDDLPGQHSILLEGLSLFEKIFGYKASFFVPPNGPINNGLLSTAAASGVSFISGSKVQFEPLGNGRTRKRYHYLGQCNKSKQLYLTRNCFFEPTAGGKDWVASCLKEIEIAFFWKKPAIISSHRVNYIGVLNESNRKEGLKQLNSLLSKLINKWPEVEFMNSSELGQLIQQQTKL